jgi:hypothetical protein
VNNSSLLVLERYLQKRSLFPPFTHEVPEKNLGIVVVIPCYSEPGILETLKSLENCQAPQKKAEVVIVINSPEMCDIEIVEQNRETKKEIKEWINRHKKRNHNYRIIVLENIPKKIAGAGYARKVGMDEAVYRLTKTNVENGIICSLDADSLVSTSYLLEIEKLFEKNKDCNGCSIYFEHAIDGNEFESEVYRRITEYELHVRYYKYALKYAGFPYYHYTVGSSFAVSAKAYCLQGGMNKKQAGEDFYFLQKIMPMGNYFELNSTCVFPSSRPSDRVPFGTGPIINQYLQNVDQEFITYNFEAFTPLKKLFTDKNLFFRADDNKIDDIIKNYHPSMVDFLIRNNFKGAIDTLNKNTAEEKNFEKRFFHWFDGFKVIKYMNFAHENYFKKQAIDEAIIALIKSAKIPDYTYINTKETLYFFRNLEKSQKKGKP